jgi:large conductance mechanosensitive channel
MGRAFRDFLLKQNALALAVGVIIGAAIGKVVSSIVADLIMPLISLVLPSGEWRAARLVLSESVAADGKPVVNAINYGTFVGTVIDFVIVAFAVFMIVRYVLRPAPDAPTKTCQFCLETVPKEASKCRACTSAL